MVDAVGPAVNFCFISSSKLIEHSFDSVAMRPECFIARQQSAVPKLSCNLAKMKSYERYEHIDSMERKDTFEIVDFSFQNGCAMVLRWLYCRLTMNDEEVVAIGIGASGQEGAGSGFVFSPDGPFFSRGF